MNKLYLYEPGNGSKYKIGIFEINGGKSYIVTWLRTQNSGVSFYFGAGSEFSLDYICKKMQIDIADAAAVMTFAQRVAPIIVPDLFQWQTILGKQTVTFA